MSGKALRVEETLGAKARRRESAGNLERLKDGIGGRVPTPGLLEESYVMRDPFTADKGRFLILGSRCSLCGRLVCVGPVGVQFILLQEILPPLCPGEHGCFPSGNPARLGEKESSIKEACQPAGVSDMSLVGVRSTAVPCMGLPGHLACGPPCFWTRKSSVCSPGELRSPCSSSRARSHAEKAPKRQPQTPVLQS
ncbi:cysteine-rich DPF motif domain-containing protein 1 isoform X7 [Camelus ferus]|uniref:Cysteine-rich DPF motif domain-containing protein 1 n=1 Tax=Camelus ferus TaxID=419612 RepID=A0A8B8U2L6_CAMFR|nr:cysteine-rich DPF motif domain-containing protein 1 isoform X7 [Camelus ferus]